MTMPRRETSEITQTFTMPNPAEEIDLRVTIDGKPVLPWRVTFWSTATYVLKYEAISNPGETPYSDTIPAIAGKSLICPPVAIDAATAPGLAMTAEY